MNSNHLREHLFGMQKVVAQASGKLTFRAVPALAEEYTEFCAQVFSSLGRELTGEYRAHFKGLLERSMTEAYSESNRSDVVVTYETAPGQALNYSITGYFKSLDQKYGNRGQTHPFGSQPDARPLALAAEDSEPGSYRVLDVGAGTGRNALAFARRGHPVDAVEVIKEFADELRAAAARESLNVRVIERDINQAVDALELDYALILASGLASEFRSAAQLREFFELAEQHVRPGGLLVLNIFLADEGFTPDEAVAQCAQQAFSTIFTDEDVASAVTGLRLAAVSDESLWDYEKSNQPSEAWPPTSWYENWATGVDVFGPNCTDKPVELRWLAFRKTP